MINFQKIVNESLTNYYTEGLKEVYGKVGKWLSSPFRKESDKQLERLRELQQKMSNTSDENLLRGLTNQRFGTIQSMTHWDKVANNVEKYGPGMLASGGLAGASFGYGIHKLNDIHKKTHEHIS